MFDIDCRSPTDAVFLPVPAQVPADLEDYKEALYLRLENWPTSISDRLNSVIRNHMTRSC